MSVILISLRESSLATYVPTHSTHLSEHLLQRQLGSADQTWRYVLGPVGPGRGEVSESDWETDFWDGPGRRRQLGSLEAAEATGVPPEQTLTARTVDSDSRWTSPGWDAVSRATAWTSESGREPGVVPFCCFVHNAHVINCVHGGL